MTATGSTFSDSLLGSFGGQPTGSTALLSQPTGAPLRQQVTGFHAGVKAFKLSSSFGASLLEALPQIPLSESMTPALDAASTVMSSPAETTGTTGVNAPAGVGLGVGLSGVTSSTTGVGIGTSGATGLGSGRSGVSSPMTGVRTGAGLGDSFSLSG
jgi:phosphatidylinositol-binding clathrin assembly protein